MIATTTDAQRLALYLAAYRERYGATPKNVPDFHPETRT